MVLGNTFHLFIEPGHEHIAEMGGLHEFMGWSGPIITDSGGFQVFSMGHGSVAEEIKRRRGGTQSRILSIEEEGVRFRAYTDGTERFMGPETSMEIQAALGSDIALAFDECTPFHVDRDYTLRSMERTHRWLDRCVAWHGEHAPGGPGALRDRAGRGGGGPAGRVGRLRGRRRAARGSRSAARWARRRRQMREVLGWSLRDLPDEPPRHLLGIGDVDDIVHAVGEGIDSFDCATPTRLARHGTALVPDPDEPLAAGSHEGRPARQPRAAGGRAARARRAATHTRGYLHYLARGRELTGSRLLTLHNLTFMAELMRGLRGAIEDGRYAEHAERVLAGDEPF